MSAQTRIVHIVDDDQAFRRALAWLFDSRGVPTTVYPSAEDAQLTPRDRQVMERILAGKYNKVIADELGISMRTVEVHRSAILHKMGVRNAVELARAIAEADSHYGE